MNYLVKIDRNIVIELTKVKRKYYVSIKPHNQEKQIFCHKTENEAYRQIFRFLMGYFTGQAEKHLMKKDELNTIITTFKVLFDTYIRFMTV